MSKATLYSWDNIENEQLNPLLSRKFVTGDQSMFARVDATREVESLP